MRMRRFYSAHAYTDSFPWVRPEVAWQVFDREQTDPDTGGHCAICLCLTRGWARNIAQALNEYEDRQVR